MRVPRETPPPAETSRGPIENLQAMVEVVASA